MARAVHPDQVEQGRQAVHPRHREGPEPDLDPEPGHLDGAMRRLLDTSRQRGTDGIQLGGKLRESSAGVLADGRPWVVHGLEQGHDLDRVDTGGIYVDAYYNPIDGVTMTGVRVRGSDSDGVRLTLTR